MGGWIVLSNCYDCMCFSVWLIRLMAYMWNSIKREREGERAEGGGGEGELSGCPVVSNYSLPNN